MPYSESKAPATYLRSPEGLVIGSSLLGAMVISYLAFISFWRAGGLASTGAIVQLCVEWVVGLIALLILFRGWRQGIRQLQTRKPGAKR